MTSDSFNPGTTSSKGLLAQLREDTREAHDRVEAAPALSCLLSPVLTVDAYVSALQFLRSFQAGALRRVEGSMSLLPPACRPDPSRLVALDADLAWFKAPLRRELALSPRLEQPEQALGVIYVVEGSSLGGRVIGRAVSQSLGVTDGAGGAFFCGQTADAARDRWRAFAYNLDKFGETMDPVARRSVIDGAVTAFAALAAFLNNDADVTQVSLHRYEHLEPAAAGQS